MKIIVIGAGAAGMMAAVSAVEASRRKGVSCSVLLLERNDRPGTKIRLSGGGACNVTHQGTPAALLEAGLLRVSERRFLRKAMYSFSNHDLLDLLTRHGVPLTERDDGSVFVGEKGGEVVVALFRRLLTEGNVALRLRSRVQAVTPVGAGFDVVVNDGEVLQADRLVVATGGVSYPHTGTVGDGLRFARVLGHTVVPPLAALAPLFLRYPAQFALPLAGVSLADAGLLLRCRGKQIRRRGALLFTHQGLSGPVVLSMSREIAELQADSAVFSLLIDLFPDQEPAAMAELMLLHAKRHGKQPVARVLRHGFAVDGQGLPAAVVPYLLERAGIGPETAWAALRKEQRQQLQVVLKGFETGELRPVSMARGEVSAGGVALGEVEPGTMASKRLAGLYFCGEVLGYAAEIGGYNLQAAFSTGWIAGLSAACGG